MNAAFRALGGAAVLAALPMAAQAQSAVPAFDWSGPYVGAHVGYQWGEADYLEPDNPGFAVEPSLDGFAGGALAGYNHQIDRFVLGAEVDGGLSGANHDAGDSGGNGYSAFDLDWNLHARLRAGVALDRTLLFVAGGLAVARLDLDDTDPGFGSDDGTHLGWTLGGGIEQAITDSLVLRLEYLYDDYGSRDYSVDSPPGPFFPSYDAEIDLSAHTLRAAVAYRF